MSIGKTHVDFSSKAKQSKKAGKCQKFQHGTSVEKALGICMKNLLGTALITSRGQFCQMIIYIHTCAKISLSFFYINNQLLFGAELKPRGYYLENVFLFGACNFYKYEPCLWSTATIWIKFRLS